MNVKTACLLLWLHLSLIHVFAQGSVRYLGIEHGLSNNAVTQIYQDRRGFMWFGTYDGLNRYDGYKFKIFRNRIGDSSSLADNNINRIQGAQDSRIWIGGRKGLSIFDPATEAFSLPRYTVPGDASPRRPLKDNILSIRVIADNQVLVGSEGLGLFIFNAISGCGRQLPLAGSVSYQVTALTSDSVNRQYWVFIHHEGLYRYDAGSHSLQLISREILQANSIMTDRGGDVWLGTDSGLFRYDVRAGVLSGNYLSGSSRVVNLYADRQGVLWIACNGEGILLLHPGEKQAEPLTFQDRKQALSSNSVYAIYEDQEGRKWIGTLRGGINIIDPTTNPFELHTFPTNNSFGQINNFIFSFCEAEDGNIWVGTDGAGLRIWNRKTNTSISYVANAADNKAIGSNFITSILRDSRQNTWVGTWFGGINRYIASDKSFRHYTCYNPLTRSAENNVWLLYEDQARRLWASTCNNGTLYLFDTASQRFQAFDPAGLSNLQCLVEGRRGDFWGGNYTSLIRIDRVHKKHIVYSLGYPVRCIREDGQGNFWVGTEGGGLLLFDREHGSFVRYTDSNGLSSNSILQMLEDKGGNLWLSTFNGLIRFDTKKRTARNFMQEDGLQSNQFTYKAAGILRSGEFVFGGIRGFNTFYPDSVRSFSEMPPVALTGIRVNNEPVTNHTGWISQQDAGVIQEITVPYEQNTISVDYAALDYRSAEKINYTYRLNGWDKEWLNAGEQRTATYTRLPEGNYTLSIRSTNAAGEWGPAVQVLRIVVLPPWYHSWWAYLLYAAAAGTLIFLYVNYTRNKERLKYEIRLAHLENEKEKEIAERKFSYFTHIAHEFRTPLTLIINPLKQWIGANTREAEPSGLTTAYRNARRLLSLMDQLLLFRKADSGGDVLKLSTVDIVALCEEVYQCFTQQAGSRQISYRFTRVIERVQIQGDYEKIEIALFNLLSNAFKFTPPGGSIDFILTETAEGVSIEICDSGCGIHAGDLERVFDKFQQVHTNGKGKAGFGIGLFLVKHFIEQHKGKVSCQSVPGQGSSFTICLLRQIPELGQAYVLEDPGRKFELLEELMGEEARDAGEEPGILTSGKTAEEVVTDKKSILLIDDNADILQYLHRLFASRYLLYTANNGADGYHLAEEHMPDLIISDINMTGMDGIELCSKIKQSPVMGHIPVILLTAATTSETRLKGIEGGADDYFTKPFDSEHLVARVEAVLKNRNTLQRYFLDSITLKESSVKVPKEYQDFLRKCITVIEENIDNEEFNMKKFSKAMGMSHSRLNQKVKAISGQRLNAFIRSIRLRRAAVLMLTENMNVSQAAFQVGISDARYFREQFVGIFGITPSEYIKKYKQSFNKQLNTIREGEE